MRPSCGATAPPNATSPFARAFLIASIGGDPIAMSDIHYGKYAGRVIARVHTAAGLDLAAALLTEGLARAYDGRGPRPRWCAGA